MTEILRLNQDNILFVCIDLQARLLEQISDASRIVARNSLLLEAVSVLKLPYIVTTQNARRLGPLDASIERLVERQALDKTTFSCASDPSFVQAWKETGITQVVVSGVETHICVLQTTLDFLQQGASVFLACDAVGARGAIDHQAGIRRMESAGAIPVTTEMVLYELLRAADSEHFRALLPAIKRASSNREDKET